MNGENVKKAFENCRDEIFERITMEKPDDWSDWDRIMNISSEMVSRWVGLVLKSDIDKIEKTVRKRLKEK